MDLHEIVMHGFRRCVDAGIRKEHEAGTEWPTLEQSVYAVLKESCETLRAMPDRERGWLRHALMKLPAKPSMNDEYAEAPKIRLRPSTEAVGRMEEVIKWFAHIQSDGRTIRGRDPDERRQIALTVTYMMAADVRKSRIARVVRMKQSSLGPYLVWGLAHIAEWLWNESPEIRREFPFHVRMPDAFARWGEHHHADTPRAVFQDPAAARKRWPGVTSPQGTKEASERLRRAWRSP